MGRRMPMWIAALLAGALAAVMPPPAVATGPGAATPAPPSQTEPNRQRVEAAFDRWARGGSGFFAEMLAPGVVWTIAGSSPTAGTYRGIDDFMARAVRPFASRMRTPVRPICWQVSADGDRVIIEWVGEAVARDERPYRNHYAWIFRMQDGKAVEVTAFLDLAPYDDVIRRIPLPSGPAR